MKKTFIALALAASVAPAWAAEVVSSNIVGYNKVTVPAGMSIIGQQFVAVGGGDQSIQEIKAEGLSDGGMDAFMVWDGTAYQEYLYYTAGDDINGDGTAAWGDVDWSPVNATIPAGTGAWISTQNQATIIFAGEVGNTATVDFVAGMNLLTQPLPFDVNIQDVTAVGLSDGGMDAMMVWDGDKYEEYLYYSASDNINGDGTAAWGDVDWTPVDATLLAGRGFWLSAQGAGTLTFPSVD